MKPRVLVVDDDAGVRYTLRGILEEAELDVEEADDGAQALKRLGEGAFQLVISDLRMPKMDGLELLKRLQSTPSAPKLILITAHGSERNAVEAIKLGAHDYFRKPFEMEELLAVVRRAVGTVRLEAENERLASEANLLQSMIFASPAMSRLAVLIRRIAPRDITVLITGESGTGKERVAEALVRASSRADRPFVRFNCASLTPQLAEAELFGHTRGAFTGAVKERTGLFREADGGTILLDEIGELELSTQAKLLRVLQEAEVRPVGGDRSIKVDVRILAATNRDLAQQVAAGKFREDLYYRLKVATLHIVPLRDRPEDIPVLARHFLARFAERFGSGSGAMTASPELIARLTAYNWPGNVRELENASESLVAMSHEGTLDLSMLPGPSRSVSATSGAVLKERVDAYERGLIVAALDAAKGNRTEAAQALGIGRATLHDKLKKYGLIGDGEPAA